MVYLTFMCIETEMFYNEIYNILVTSPTASDGRLVQ